MTWHTLTNWSRLEPSLSSECGRLLPVGGRTSDRGTCTCITICIHVCSLGSPALFVCMYMYTVCMHTYMYVCMTTQLMKKTRQGNTTQQEGKAIKHNIHVTSPKTVTQVGLKPTTFCGLDRCSYLLSYRGSSAGWAESHVYTNQSIST